MNVAHDIRMRFEHDFATAYGPLNLPVQTTQSASTLPMMAAFREISSEVQWTSPFDLTIDLNKNPVLGEMYLSKARDAAKPIEQTSRGLASLSGDYTIQPSALALAVASFQAFPINAACEIGDRRSTSSGKCLL